LIIKSRCPIYNIDDYIVYKIKLVKFLIGFSDTALEVIDGERMIPRKGEV